MLSNFLFQSRFSDCPAVCTPKRAVERVPAVQVRVVGLALVLVLALEGWVEGRAVVAVRATGVPAVQG